MLTSKRNVTRLILALCLLATAPFVGRVQGQGTDPNAESGQQTLQSLKRMIDDMGYESKEVKRDGQVVQYVLTVPQGTRNWLICIDISPNKENLWLSVNLAKVPDPKNLPRNILEEMLKANEVMGPSYFAYDARSSMFVMYQPLHNQAITPKLVRRRLDDLATRVGKYENLWNPNLWTQTGPAPVDPPGPSIAVRKLMQGLESPDELVRLKAAKDLGKLGAGAKDALPALRKLLQDPDEDVRAVVAGAIERIQGGVAPPPAAGASLVGTTWDGSESLMGFGKLTFRLQAEGKAVMVDATANVNGTWTQNGDKVTITFKNCVYEGTIKGQVLSGSARFTSGNEANWTFSVTRAASQAP